LVAVLLNGIVEFGWARPWLRPARSFVSGPLARRILRMGLLFFVLQLTIVTTVFSDNLIVAQVLDSSAVTQYAVPAKLFGFVGSLVAMLVWSLWPAYGEAIARGDILWARRTLARSLAVTLVATAAPALVFAVLGGPIVHLWVGDAVDPSSWLLAGLAAWALVSGLGSTLSIFLNGASILKAQVVCGVCMFATSLPLKAVFAEWWGVAGVPWAATISYVFCFAGPLFLYVPRVFERLHRERVA
jgi:O-antigen/teichoic acid export membrane protein